MQRIRDCGVLRSRRNFFMTPYPQGWESISEDRAERARACVSYSETVFSGCGSAVAHMSSQWLGFQAQDLHKTKQSKSQREWGRDSWSPTLSWGAVCNCWLPREEDSVFFKDEWLWNTARASVDGSIAMLIEVELHGVSGYKIKWSYEAWSEKWRG